MLYVTKSHASPEVIAATEQAAALASKSDNLRQLGTWLNSKALAALLSGDLPSATVLADRAMYVALREGNFANLGVVHVLHIMLCYWRGDLIAAEKYFAEGLRFFDDPEFRQFPGSAVAAFGFASLNACTLGLIETARKREAQMMAVANDQFPYDVGLAGILAGYLRVYLREFEQARAKVMLALEVSEKHHLLTIAAASQSVLGLARAQLGLAREGIGLIRQGVHDLLEMGSGLSITRENTYLAQAQDRDGEIDAALRTIESALTSNPDEIAYRPETLRLRGELHFKQGKKSCAEADLLEAIALAKKIGAKLWELRATVSLVRLIARHDRPEKACAMLAEIYHWFAEGFDTPDLKEAKALLDELSR
jgi:tetratricopeptide (TPR) repeat protein